MKKIVLSLLTSCFVFSYLHAQLNYTFQTEIGTGVKAFQYLSAGATSAPLETSDTDIGIDDEGLANNIPIGFTFNYNGIDYTQVHANTNGFISFIPLILDPPGQYFQPSLRDFTISAPGSTDGRPILAPLGDDLQLAAITDLKYETTGAPGSQIFTIEWKNILWEFFAAAPGISFQIRLYEGSNEIEFVYHPEAGDLASPQAQIGITGTATGDNNFISVRNNAATDADFTTDIENLVDTKPEDNRIYRFIPAVPTPVKLSSFTVQLQGTSSQLTWTTASEDNNKGFQIQHSIDGTNFSNVAFIASKASNGTSSLPLTYTYSHAQPTAGINYYRLLQTDHDGKTSYSPVVMVDNNKGQLTLAIQQLSPNPATDAINVAVQSPAAAKAELIITDAQGKIVKKQVLQLIKGNNTLQLNVAQLPASVYTVALKSNNVTVSQQFVKQ